MSRLGLDRPGSARLDKHTLLQLLRVSRSCPLQEVRERAAELLRTAQVRVELQRRVASMVCQLPERSKSFTQYVIDSCHWSSYVMLLIKWQDWGFIMNERYMKWWWTMITPVNDSSQLAVFCQLAVCFIRQPTTGWCKTTARPRLALIKTPRYAHDSLHYWKKTDLPDPVVFTC